LPEIAHAEIPDTYVHRPINQGLGLDDQCIDLYYKYMQCHIMK